MKSLLSYLIATLTAFFNGTSYVEPQQKPYDPDTYYQTTMSEEDIDYKDFYNQILNGSSQSKEKCDRGQKEIDANRLKVNTGDGVSQTFPVALAKASDYKQYLQQSTEDGEDYYILEVPQGTEVLAPMNCTLKNSSVNVLSAYPKGGDKYTKGVGLTLKTDTNSDGVSYVIEFGSLERLWCCIGKTEPDVLVDDDATQPIYYHSEPFNSTIKFNQGDVIGIAGNSGVPLPSRKEGKAFVKITITKIVDGKTSTATLSELCGEE